MEKGHARKHACLPTEIDKLPNTEHSPTNGVIRSNVHRQMDIGGADCTRVTRTISHEVRAQCAVCSNKRKNKKERKSA